MQKERKMSNMYKFRAEKREEIINKFKISYIAEQVGISLSYLSRVINGRKNCTKVVAYCITKMVDSEKEVDYFFEKI
jgi:plasmid maintenance system antidote protein VapI